MEFHILRRDEFLESKKLQNLLRPGEDDKTLHLERYEATETQIQKEINKLTENCIEKIIVKKVTFSDKKCELLAKLIRENEHLIDIIIEKCKFRQNHMEAIADALGKNESVQNITFSNVKIIINTAKHLASALSQNMSLKSLTLIETGLGDGSLTELAKGIKESICLETIDLRNNNFEQ